MEAKDLIITPIIIAIIFLIAFLIRNNYTDHLTRKYFFPALSLKVLAAILLGFIYQFYYEGGDTFAFHTFGSKHIWNTLKSSPWTGLELIFGPAVQYNEETYLAASKIWFYKDSPSYFIVRISALFDIFTFGTYSGTAVLFAVFSFIGMWSLFNAFYKIYPQLHFQLAISFLFIPSVVFWGSGILKDSVVLGALGLATALFVNIFFNKKMSLWNISLFIFFMWVIYSVKIYVIMCLLPSLLIWYFFKNITKIKNKLARLTIAPFLLFIVAFLGYYSVDFIIEDNSKYSYQNLTRTVKITAYDIGFYTGRDAGSGYSLGELDETFGSIITKIPQSIGVTLFRPYLWEINRPLMALTAIESLFFLIITLSILFNPKFYSRITRLFSDPDVVFCFTFSIIFAFAVGIATYNFGTLARYKIPLMPFYLAGIFIARSKLNSIQTFDSRGNH